MRGITGFVKKGPLQIDKIAFYHGPLQRHPLAGPFLERVLIGGHGVLQPPDAGFALPEGLQRSAQIIEGRAAFIQGVGAGKDKLGNLNCDAQIKCEAFVAACLIIADKQLTQRVKLSLPACGQIGLLQQ